MKEKDIFGSDSYLLNAEGIDRISQRIEYVGTYFKMERKTIHRYRLSVEDSLIKWMETEDSDAKQITFTVGKRSLKPFFKIAVPGNEYNPYMENREKDEFGTVKNNILFNIGLVPEYTYTEGNNTLQFNIKRKEPNQILLLLGIITVAVIIGLIGCFFFSENTLTTLSDSLITPIKNTFFNILSAIAGPMIFLSVVWGLYSIGDVYTLGRIGKKMMLYFISIIFCFAAFGCLFYPFFGSKLSTEGSMNNQFSKIFEMMLEIFPSDIFTPFIEGNTLQIIFLAFVIGISLIFLGQRISSVAKVIEQINNIVTFVMGYVSKAVPYFFLLLIANMLWSGAIKTFSAVWKFAVIFFLATLGAQLLYLIYVSVTCRENPFYLLKSVLPSCLIALSTASSSATFESNIRICDTKLGIKPELFFFGVPFGTAIFRPTTALYYLLMCFYFANAYAINVSLAWIITALIITAVSAIATPPIPGGASATYAMLFLQLGIPTESLVLVIAVDMVFDFFLTSSEMYMLLLTLFRLSKKLGLNRN